MKGSTSENSCKPLCIPGQYYDLTTESCKGCPLGKYSKTTSYITSSDECEGCTSGR